jgi:hypothetical protein
MIRNWRPYKLGALCRGTGCTPLEPALFVLNFVRLLLRSLAITALFWDLDTPVYFRGGHWRHSIWIGDECGWRVKSRSNEPVFKRNMSPPGFFLAWLTLQLWRWKRHIRQKCLLTFNRLHGTISQKIKLITTAVITSESKQSWINSSFAMLITNGLWIHLTQIRVKNVTALLELSCDTRWGHVSFSTIYPTLGSMW